MVMLGEAGSLTQIWETLLPHFPIARAFSEKNYTKLFIHLGSSAGETSRRLFFPGDGQRCPPRRRSRED